MRTKLSTAALLLLLVAALAVVTGCGDGAPECRADADCTFPAACLDGVCRGPADAVEVNPRLQALEREGAFVSLERDGDLFRFYFDRPADALGMRAGDLIVGRSNGGYLRRVEAVEAVGKTLELQTTIAPLSDALRGEVQLHFGPDDGLGSKSDGLRQHRQALSSCSGPDSDHLCLDLSGEVLYDDHGLEVKLAEGSRLSLEPQVDFQYVGQGPFDLPVVIDFLEVRVAFDAELDLGLEIEATLEDEIEIEKPLISIERTMTFFVGQVPVVVTLQFEVAAGLVLDAHVTGRIAAGYQRQHHYEWKADYLRDRAPAWQTYFFEWGSDDVRGPEYELESSAGAKVFIKPSVSMVFYETIGGSAYIEGYLEWISHLLPREYWELAWGVAAGLELELGWLEDTGLIEPPEGLELFSQRQVLADGYPQRVCVEQDVYRTDPVTGEPKEHLASCDALLPPQQCIDGQCYAVGEGVIAGRVTDALTTAPIAGAFIDLSRGGESLQTLQTDADGTFQSERLPAGPTQVEIAKSGYIPAQATVAVEAGEVTHTAALRQLPASCEDGWGSAAGTVRDAATGEGLPATCRLRRGRGVSDGGYLIEWTTGSDGGWDTAELFPIGEGKFLPPGHYTLEASLTGYAPAWIDVLVCGGRTMPNQDANLAPVDGRHRLVLEWGKEPADLDLHLFTPPLPPGLIDAEAYHVFFREDCRGSLDAAPRAELENDAQDGRGPETIAIDTFYDTPPDRPYSVMVHDYSQDNESGEIADLAASGATLTLYGTDGAVLERFAVPSKSEKSWWHVCDLQLNDGRLAIIPVDAITAGTNPDTYPGCWPPGQEQP